MLVMGEPVLTFYFESNAAWEEIELECRDMTQMKDNFKHSIMVINFDKIEGCFLS